MRQAITLTLPFMMQPITNGENGEPKEIEVSDISNLCVRLQGVGETGQGKKIGLSGETRYEIDGSNIVLHIASLDDYGYAKAIVSGKYGQVCLRAEVSLLSGTEGETSFSLPAYVFKVVDNSTAAATIVAESVEDLKRAIAELPDGQAVSVKVAEHTVALSKLHILTVDEMDTLGNYCTSLADLSEKYSLINLTFTDESGTVVCASILPSTDSEHGWLYEFQEGWRVCKMNEYEFYPENDFLDLASYMDGHSTRIATKAETGEPSDLTTEDKSNIVAGVNEVNGKVGDLQSEITELEGEINKIVGDDEVVDLESITKRYGYYDTSNNVWTGRSSLGHIFVGLSGCVELEITANDGGLCRYAFVKELPEYDADAKPTTPLVYADGCTEEIITVGKKKVLEVPSDAKYLYFNIYGSTKQSTSSNHGWIPQNLFLKGNGALPEMKTQIEELQESNKPLLASDADKFGNDYYNLDGSYKGTSTSRWKSYIFKNIGFSRIVAYGQTSNTTDYPAFILQYNSEVISAESCIDVTTFVSTSLSKYEVDIKDDCKMLVVSNRLWNAETDIKIYLSLGKIAKYAKANTSSFGSAIYDNQVVNVAYSSIDTNYPINTIEHFMNAIKLGYNAIKTDMRLTSDGKIVLCHDAGFTFNEDGRITSFDSANCTLIHNMTYQQCLSLEHGSTKAFNHLGYYAHVCGLEDFLKICKEYGIIPYITFREEYIPETANELFRLLKKYGLTSRAIINCYHTLPVARAVKAINKDILVCYTIDKESKTGLTLTQQIESTKDEGLEILCFNLEEIETLTNDDVEFAANHGIRLYGWSMTSYEMYQDMVSKGLVGFQITTDIGLKCLTPAALSMRLLDL